VKIVKVDIDESMDLAQEYRIMSVPNMVIFQKGIPVDGVVGAVPPAYLKEKLDEFVK
jgi:thioredoxin 1